MTVKGLIAVFVVLQVVLETYGKANITRVGGVCEYRDADPQWKCSAACRGIEFCNKYNVVTTWETCASGKYCGDADGEYSCSDENICAPDGLIWCETSGTYPIDPTLPGWCTHYAECDIPSGDKFYGLIDSCGGGLQYNPCSGKCDTFHTGSCSGTPVTCGENDHYIDILDSNNDNQAIYYKCEKGTIIWNKCAAGQVFAPHYGQCISLSNRCTAQ